MTKSIEQINQGWRLTGGDVVLDINHANGTLRRFQITAGQPFVWTSFSGDVKVRDDLLRYEFDSRDIKRVQFHRENDTLIIEKQFSNAPWILKESYRPTEDVIQWDAEVVLDGGDFRSCCVTYHLPWAQPLYPVRFWAARKEMPAAPHEFAELALEYGEITSGILIPALCSYLENEDAGFMVAMPFEFKTPRFRFLSGYRDPDLRIQFDWLALATGKPAKTSLMFKGTGGAWRPALGWLFERYREYFEPRSNSIHNLWGGHVSGNAHVSDNEVRTMKELGLKWYEQHGHFQAYGNYHPEGIEQWRSGHHRKDETMLSVELLKSTIKRLKDSNVAVLPYIQVTGDGDVELLPEEIRKCGIRNIHGETVSAWPGTELLNSDPALAFGQDMIRQIDGMISRYSDIDGVFLDQGCYNFLDTAHDDGITAINNRPAYMTGFNYSPHLEHLSSLLHPSKSIIANAPHAVSILKYIDAFMAEGSGWLCDHLQYYSLAKPMFFLMYESDDRNVELMFQRCLIYGAGYSSYEKANVSKDLYKQYVPLVEKMFKRRWVFTPKPIEMPVGFDGNVFRSPNGSLISGIVNSMSRLGDRKLSDNSIRIQTGNAEKVSEVFLQVPGEMRRELSFGQEDGAVQFELPGDMVAGVVEIFE